jgi:hypothetical protein
MPQIQLQEPHGPSRMPRKFLDRDALDAPPAPKQPAASDAQHLKPSKGLPAKPVTQ